MTGSYRGRTAVQDAGRDDRITVAEAADRLGITKEAVRKRVSRGTLRSDKEQDGTVRVYVPASAPPSGTADRGELVEELRDRLRYVEGQLESERQAHAEARRIIAGLVERMPPAIEAPSDEQGSPETVEEEPERAEPHSATGGTQEAVRRPWWRRMFGGSTRT